MCNQGIMVGRHLESRIYEIRFKDCDEKYLKKALKTRCKAHFAHLRYRSVAHCVWKKNDSIDESCLNLVSLSIIVIS